MTEIVQTRPGGPPRVYYAVPMVTALAALDERDDIHGRQIYEDCGYYQHDDNTKWRTWRCIGGSVTVTTCNTLNDYFGCYFPIPTTCFASGRGCDIQNSRALCCTDSDYPACGTAYKAVGRREITAFDCANNELEVSLYISTDFSTSQSDEDISSTASTTAISSIETTGSVETSISIKKAPTTTESAPAGQTSSSDNDPKDSSTPIGPIIGGVIGGLALIALIGVVLWFLRRKKHIPSHSDSNLHSTANYHPQPQALPDEGYTNPTYNAPPYDHPPMSSAPRNVSQNFSTLHYAASPQTSEFPSTPGRPKTPELG